MSRAALVATAILACVPPPVVCGAGVSAPGLGPRTVQFTYRARAVVPDTTGVLELWLPLPREDDQSVLDLRLGGSGPARVVHLPGGDRAAYLRVTAPRGPVTLTQTATIVRREIRVPLDGSRTRLADVDRAAFAVELASTPSILVNDEIRAIARRVTAGRTTVVAQARALYDWVFDHMRYDKSVPGWGLGDVPYCLRVGRGNCTDFHSLFIALARASGIPARWNLGFPLAYEGTPGRQPVQGYHCWAEFWVPGRGWVPVDISEARKHPELRGYFFGSLSGNRVLFTRTRDGLLEPDAAGHRFNYFIYPIVRADGADVPDVEWTFEYDDISPASQS